MKIQKSKKSSGAVSSVLLVLAVVLILVIVGVYLFIKFGPNKANSAKNVKNTTENQVPKPVTETTIGDVRFIFQSARDLGNVIKNRPSQFEQLQVLTTTEKFIQVTIGAQNKGKVNVARDVWNVGNIVDSEGRNFVPINDQVYYFSSSKDLCGSLLKPEFTPVPCVKLYEVSKQSTGLKVKVSIAGQSASKKQESFIDLTVTK